MTETITIEVTDEALVEEIGYGILGRAGDIHDNPDDEYEHHAEELREIGTRLTEE